MLPGMMSDLAGMVLTVAVVAPGTYWLLSNFWNDLATNRRERALLQAQSLDEFVASTLCGPDPATGRCRQCGIPIQYDEVVVHARLHHDLHRPRGAEDDPQFIADLWRQES